MVLSIMKAIIAALLLYAVLVAHSHHKTHTEEPVTSEAVVLVETDNGHGTGVLINHDVVYTSAHVIKGANKIRVKDSSGGISDVLGLQVYEESDFAILILESPSVVRPAKYSCKEVSPRDVLYTVGYPLDFPRLTFEFVVAGYYNHDPIGNQLLVTGVNLPGNSGGPVFNAKGEVVGLVHGEWNYGMEGPDGSPVVVDADLNIVIPLSFIEAVCGAQS